MSSSSYNKLTAAITSVIGLLLLGSSVSAGSQGATGVVGAVGAAATLLVAAGLSWSNANVVVVVVLVGLAVLSIAFTVFASMQQVNEAPTAYDETEWVTTTPGPY